MPTETSFVKEIIAYHALIPVPFGIDVSKLEDYFFVDYYHEFIILHNRVDIPLIKVLNTKEPMSILGKLIKESGQPWWDFCLHCTDDTEWAEEHDIKLESKHAHALSILRVFPDGNYDYLFHRTKSLTTIGNSDRL